MYAVVGAVDGEGGEGCVVSAYGGFLFEIRARSTVMRDALLRGRIQKNTCISRYPF